MLATKGKQSVLQGGLKAAWPSVPPTGGKAQQKHVSVTAPDIPSMTGRQDTGNSG